MVLTVAVGIGEMDGEGCRDANRDQKTFGIPPEIGPVGPIPTDPWTDSDLPDIFIRFDHDGSVTKKERRPMDGIEGIYERKKSSPT